MNRPKNNTLQQAKSPGWRHAAILGIFMYSVCVGDEVYAQGASEVKPPRPTSSNTIFAANSSLRSVEGELLIWVDDPPQALTPTTWRSSAAGVIQCGTESQKIRFAFQFSQTAVPDATASCKVGIVDATVTNTGTSKIQAALWMVWRYAYASNDYPLGFSLGGDAPSNESAAAPSEWKSDSTWFFQDSGFIRDGRILYIATVTEGWERLTWVRRPTTPYRDLTEQSFVGYTLFRRQLDPNQQASVRALVPHQSLPIAQRPILSQIIPHAE